MVEEVITLSQPIAMVLITAGIGAAITSLFAFIRFSMTTKSAVDRIPWLEKKMDANTNLTAEIGKSLANLMPVVAMHSKVVDETLPEFRAMQREMGAMAERIKSLQEKYSTLNITSHAQDK